ncbi:MAG: hypothetical protein IJI73_01015 [Kiritimatiellae bacterium]|nr:hypothetical protein [Kiritimatiellia bacterium]
MTMTTRCLRAAAVPAVACAFAASAFAAPYDYEVEYVKSAHMSVVKTDLLPDSGLSFRMDVMFEGPYNQIFGGKFDMAKQTTVFFGQEDPADADRGRGLYQLEFGGHEAQAFQSSASFGRKSQGKWTHCGTQELNDSVVGSRISISYDGSRVSWGSFSMKLGGARTESSKVPVSFFGMTRADGTPKSYGCYDMTLYGATFYRDGKPVAEFIPVVKGGVAGLYEKVSKKFYASATRVPLSAGPKVAAKGRSKGRANVRGKREVDFSVPIFEDDFTSDKLFAERWEFLGHAQKTISIKDGACRIPSGTTGDGIRWKGELPDECAVEADFVCYPEWSGIKDPKDGDYHWASMGCDCANYGVRSDGYGVSLYKPEPSQPTRSCYPWIANFKEREPVTVRFERRRIGDSMVGYTFLLNGVKVNYFTAPAPKKTVGFDGVERSNPLVIDNFNCPFEVRRVTVYALQGGDSPNLIANSGFEFDSDGVPPHYCNRGWCDMGRVSVEDYKEKYLRSFMVDKSEKHSGSQSLRLRIGPFIRSLDFFAWNTPTQKGRSGVLSVWAKASEPGVKLKLKVSKDAKVVDLTTDWARYEVTTTNMPAPGYFSPAWFEVPDVSKRTTDASIWLDDLQLEMVDAPEGGFDPNKTYATEYKPKSGDAENFTLGKPTPHAKPERTAPLSPAENALCGYTPPKEGLLLGHYDFYMNEKTADFRAWDGKGGFEQVSLDISGMPCGTNAVMVKALGRDWKAEVRKLPFRKGATQINQWSRTLVHDGEKVFMSAPCLIGRENAPQGDGTSKPVDILCDAGFKYLNLQNNLNVRDIEMNQKTFAYARKKGMKFTVWTGEGQTLDDVGEIRRWEDNSATDWSRQKMYEMLGSEDVINWLVLDEPEYRKADECKAFMKRTKALFPYNPVQMNNCWLGISGRFAGLPTDILMVDYYLTTDGTTMEMVVSKVDVLRSIAPGKPCWYFMESENSLHPRIPSYKEQIAQCWGSVAAGASGLSWFVNMPTSRCCYDALVDINRELMDNVDFLCSDELCGGAVASETENYIRCLTRRHGDEWRVYTANINPHPNAKVSFALPADVPQGAKVEVMYENRSLQAKDGVFSDAFDGFSRHIYRIAK